MKKLAQLVEVSGEGLESLLGENVLVTCMRYNYAGKLIGVNDKFLKLEGCKYVFDTGTLKGKSWTTSEDSPSNEHFIMLSSIEGICVSGR